MTTFLVCVSVLAVVCAGMVAWSTWAWLKLNPVPAATFSPPITRRSIMSFESTYAGDGVSASMVWM